MLRAARKRTAALVNVELRHGELEALPLADQEVDAALLLLALSYVGEPRRVLEELARVVRPDGRAVVVDLLRHDREEFRRQMGQRRLGFETGELAGLLQEAGFVGVRCQPLSPEPGARGPALVLAAGSQARGEDVQGARVARREREGAR
jgi:ArsR family transcriptional regulator